MPRIKTHLLLLNRIKGRLHKVTHRGYGRLILSFILTSVILSTVFLVILFRDLPNPQRLTKSPAPVSTKILDRNGKLLYDVYVDQNRQPTSFSDISPYVIQATISIEDKNYYYHHGLDTRGILRAAYKTITGQRLEGGSTITQQLVKIALLDDRSRTLTRKIREAGLSLVTEIIYSKDQILELYLNHAPYGGTTYGIGTAAQTYFNKNVKDLTLAESALLAGLPQSPTKYSPFGANPEFAIERQHQVLASMLASGYITPDQEKAAKSEPLNFSSKKDSISAPHFSLMVRDLLIDKYGEDLVNLGGLRVTTTLDLDLQQRAESTVSSEITKIVKYHVSNGAALITKPKTGEILAMIGSKNYFDTENDGNVNLTMRQRQPGSSIKPLNYAVGLLRGWTLSTMFLDTPTCFSTANQPLYCPQNYDGSFHGPVQMRFALGNSYNIPAVKMLALNSLDALIATASAMGITTWTDKSRFGLSLTLGGGEVTMWDMATAFGTFANAGVTVPLNPILKVETYLGQVLEENRVDETADHVSTLHQDWSTFWENQTNSLISGSSPGIRVSLPEEVAFLISHVLLDNGARTGAFGNTSQLVIPKKTVSVKTGTTNDLRDNWTIGFTPEILVATWVGNNDSSPMSNVVSGVTGASVIWHNLMTHLLKDQPDRPPQQPDGIKSHQVCNQTGLLAIAENQCSTRNEFFIENHLPPAQIAEQRQVWVRRSDKYPLLPGDNTIDLDLELHTVATDPFVSDFCLDCNYPKNDKGHVVWPQTIINFDTFQQNSKTATNYLSPHTPTP